MCAVVAMGMVISASRTATRPEDATRIASSGTSSATAPNVAASASFLATWLADVTSFQLSQFYAGEEAARRAEEEARAAQERAGSGGAAVAPRDLHPLPAPAAPSGYPPECYGHVVAPAILMRESGCSYTAFNAGGCSGRGCIGMYQLDEGHFYAVSPWNSNTHGVCYGLSYAPADQDECASRLGPGAWG